VIGQPCFAVFLKHGIMTRADESSLRAKEEGATSFHHGFTILSNIGAGDFIGPADTDVVGALNTPATIIKRDEEIVILAMLDDMRSLDGMDSWAASQRGDLGMEFVDFSRQWI
jgi:hypothetical protein